MNSPKNVSDIAQRCQGGTPKPQGLEYKPQSLTRSPSRTSFMSALNSTILSSVAGEDNQLVSAAVGVAAIIATAAYYVFSSRSEKHDFPKLRGIQLYHAWNFFRRRTDFLLTNFKRNSGKSFSFNILHHKVIALAGEDARRVFFSDTHLSFGEGYKILMGSVRISRS